MIQWYKLMKLFWVRFHFRFYYVESFTELTFKSYFRTRQVLYSFSSLRKNSPTHMWTTMVSVTLSATNLFLNNVLGVENLTRMCKHAFVLKIYNTQCRYPSTRPRNGHFGPQTSSFIWKFLTHKYLTIVLKYFCASVRALQISRTFITSSARCWLLYKPVQILVFFS